MTDDYALPPPKIDGLAAVTFSTSVLTSTRDRDQEVLALRKSRGMRTVDVSGVEEGFEMVYEREVFWEVSSADPDTGALDEIRVNSVSGINSFEDSYRQLKRGKLDMPRALFKHAEGTIKHLLRTPIVNVEPELAIAMLARVERQFFAEHGPPDITSYEWDEKTLKKTVTNLYNDVLSACWKPPNPITFAFYEGIALSDLEVAWRMFLDGGRRGFQRSRVVWGYHLQPDTCFEFGGDFFERTPRDYRLRYEGDWMPDSYFYSYFLADLYTMAMVLPVKFQVTEKSTYKASPYKRDHYHLDVSVEDALAFMDRLDAGEEPMKKGTVYDNIPCLDLDIGEGHPVVKISCNKCDEVGTRAITRVGLAPHIFLKQWARDGWDIKGDGKKATCPQCVAAKRRPKVEKKAPILAVVPPEPPLHQRQSAARMVLGRTSLSPKARDAAKERCREAGIEEGDIIRISLKAQGINPDGTDMEEKGSDGKRRTFSIGFKREFVHRAMILETGARRRLLDANDIHPGMFRRWRQEIHAADKAESDPESVEPEISESLIDGMIDQGVALAQRVEASLDDGEFSDDFKLEVVGTCADLDELDQRNYLQSLDITDDMYAQWLQEIEPEEQPERDPRAPVVISEGPIQVTVTPGSEAHPAGAPANGGGADPALMFKLFTLFEKGIDKKRMRYNNGWSDERVAEESGVEVTIVASVREQTIGRILTPAMVEAVKARMAQREVKYEADVKAARDLILDMENKYDEDMKALRAEIGQ